MYTPPLPVYLPLEKIVEMSPNYEYQAYFASPESTREIADNVSGP